MNLLNYEHSEKVLFTIALQSHVVFSYYLQLTYLNFLFLKMSSVDLVCMSMYGFEVTTTKYEAKPYSNQ